MKFVLCVLLTWLGACAWSNPANRPVWSAFENHLVPEHDAAFYATLPLTVPAGFVAIAADSLLVHPVQTQYVYTAYHRSADGGATWSSLNPPVRPIRCLTVDPADPDRIWSVGGQLRTYVHYTSDGGTSWQELNTLDLPAMNGIRIARVENGHDGLLVAQEVGLHYIDERFSNWQPADDGLAGTADHRFDE